MFYRNIIFLFQTYILLRDCLILDDKFRANTENIKLLNCLISTFFVTNNNGGAIYIDGNYNMSIQDSIFYECILVSEGYNGGAIYFINGYNSELQRICVMKCKTGNDNNGQFSWIEPVNYFENKIEFVSIVKCYNNTNGYTPILLKNGNQKNFNTNISLNYNRQISSIYYYSPNEMNTNHCSILNNSVNNGCCLELCSNKGNISKSNIINNNSKNFYGVIMVTKSGFLSFFDSIFQNNEDTLLCIWSGSISLLNCIINQKITTYGAVIINPINTFLTNTYLINHFETQNIFSNQLINCLGQDYHLKLKSNFGLINLILNKSVFLINFIFY